MSPKHHPDHRGWVWREVRGDQEVCEEYLLERSFVVAAYLDQTYPAEVFVVEVGIWRNNHSGWRGKGGP